MITQLIKLDAYTMKPLWKMAVGFLVVPLIVGIFANPFNSIMIMMTFVAFLLNIVFSIGEKSHFDKLYGTLPIQRRQIVIGRYLFALLVLCGFAICSYGIFLLLGLIHGEIQLLEGFAFLCISTLIAVFFISVQFPVYFRFDYSKAAFMSVIPYLICFAIGAPVFSKLMENKAFNTSVMKLVMYFNEHLVFLIILTFLGMLILICISYLLSSYMMHKKQG